MQETQVVVIGCGFMGCDIAAIFLKAGWQVQAVEATISAHEGARQRMQSSTESLGGVWNPDQLKLHTSLESIDWKGVRLVVETVTENLAVKQEVFRTLDTCVPAEIPIGSNSSGFRITDIAEGCQTAERMANAHFFLPAHTVPLVELAKGERTSDACLDALQRAFEEVGRAVVRIQKDLPGFLANRMQHALMREAFSILDAGLATPEDVDKAVRYGFGFRYASAGPMLQKEFAGLDTQLVAATSIYPSLCNDPNPPKILTDLVAQGRTGTRALKGFWNWTPEELAAERARYESVLSEVSDIIARNPSALPKDSA